MSYLDDSYSVSLLHMDNPAGSTIFDDESGNIWTANGGAQITTAQAKFGGSSGLFSGSARYITTPDSTDFTFGSANFTVDFWMRPNLLGSAQNICGQSNSTPTVTTISFYVQQTAANQILGVMCNGSTQNQAFSTGTVTTGNWYHVAMVRNGNNLAVALNGIFGTSVNVTGLSANDSSNNLSIGRMGENNANYYNGWIDEFRISKGIARWTSNFTPPNGPYAGFTFQRADVVGV